MSKSVIVRYCMSASVVALVGVTGYLAGCEEKKPAPKPAAPTTPAPAPAEKK
jgi:hypothetical protein